MMTVEIDNKIYFSEETDAAIKEYVISEDSIKRSKIYNEHIKKAFEKLVENWIFILQAYKYTDSYSDLYYDTIRFLCERLSKFKYEKGRAFSYFTVITKNYLIQYMKTAIKKNSQSEEVEIIDMERNLENEVSYKDFTDNLHEFFEVLIVYLEKNLAILFPNRKEMSVADSIIELCKKRHNIEDYNKKALYILIRERTGVKTQVITKSVNNFKKIYQILYKDYTKYERIVTEPYNLQKKVYDL